MDSAKSCGAVFEEVIPTGICNIVSEGLVICHLYENDTNDSSGYKNHGIKYGEISYIDVKTGKAIKFDGNGYLLIMDKDSSIIDTDTAMSLSMLIKFDHLDNEHGSWFMTKYCSSGPCPGIGEPEGDWVLRTGFNTGSENGEDLIFGVQNYVKYQESASPVKVPSILSVNTWQHLVITFDTGIIKIYLNGQLIKESIRSVEEMSTQEYTLDDIFIGKTRFTNSNEYDFIGALDEFRLYNRAITEQEVQTLYNLGQPAQSGLTVTKTGEGRGRIMVKVNGEDWTIKCNSNCQQANYDYAPNSELTIRAYSDEGFNFIGWTGDCTGTISRVKLTLDTAKTCTAQFEPKSANNLLTVSKTGNGSITSKDGYINCGETCSTSYILDQTVILQAIPTVNELFIGWTGDCDGLNPKVTVTMDATKTCSATFQTYDANESFILKLINSGEGLGKITANIKGESNSIVCKAAQGCQFAQQDYQAGTKLVINATPAVGSEFTSGDGDCPALGNPMLIAKVN
ncbi:MAG: sialidase domain-containing protein [Candidatus Marithrix sp.]